MWTAKEQLLFERIVALRETGRLSEALEHAQALVQTHPDNAKLHWFVGHLYWRSHRLEQACRSFRKATILSPTMESASLGLFHCLWEQGQHQEALAEANRFLGIAESRDYRAILRELQQTD